VDNRHNHHAPSELVANWFGLQNDSGCGRILTGAARAETAGGGGSGGAGASC